MNYYSENVATDLGHAGERGYVYGEWVSYSDDFSSVTIHGDQTKALVAAVTNDLNVVYLPHGAELHEYTERADDLALKEAMA